MPNGSKVFMMSSILLNPQLIVYSTALGSVASAIRIISSFVCGIAAGLLVRWFYHDKSFFNFAGFEELKSSIYDYRAINENHESWSGKDCAWREAFYFLPDFCHAVLVYFGMGCQLVVKHGAVTEFKKEDNASG